MLQARERLYPIFFTTTELKTEGWSARSPVGEAIQSKTGKEIVSKQAEGKQ